jgi:hypothetical protein
MFAKNFVTGGFKDKNTFEIHPNKKIMLMFINIDNFLLLTNN